MLKYRGLTLIPIYDMLTENKYRVFFSRITLEDKLGVEYEPYIFAALNSARIMLAIGTDYEYYNAVWVKNEWSRFLQLMAKDRKKSLIPCYKNIDAYDIPREFSKLQAQDLGKIGALQDLLRGIKKLLPKDEQSEGGSGNQTLISSGSNANLVLPLLERAFIFLDEGNWKTADDYFERVLDLDPKNPRAYVGKLLLQARCTNEDELFNSNVVVSELPIFKSFSRFGDEAFKERLRIHDEEEKEKQRQQQMKAQYQKAIGYMKEITNPSLIESAHDIFQELGDYKDSMELIKQCDAEVVRRAIAKKNYDEAVDLMKSNTVHMVSMALGLFKEAGDYEDAPILVQQCEQRLVKLREEEEISNRARKKVMLEREIPALKSKYDGMSRFNSSERERTDLKYKIMQKQRELKQIAELVKMDEEKLEAERKRR